MNMIRILVPGIILFSVVKSCETERPAVSWFENEYFTIGEYLNQNQQEYSKSYRLLTEGRMLGTLGGYNPYGEGYTLFLPTDEAIDQFISSHEEYTDFDNLLKDTTFLQTLTRYHTVNNVLHTNDFPNGALKDTTLTGERLTIGLYSDDDLPLYKVNNVVPIVKSNLEMTNGYIHVVSGVLQPVEIGGYDWLQLQDEYTILAQAMELSEIKNRLWWDQYTILAEPDSIYERYGISNIEELVDRIATPGIPYSDRTSDFYQFTAYHIMRGEFYLNDLYLGTEDYRTLGNERVIIDVGTDIRINPGLVSYGTEITETGDTIAIDYIRLLWEGCNILTHSGPIHTISELLVDEPWP
jgi:uncharacterized surface protein with fasciclin (FAS1) repeats